MKRNRKNSTIFSHRGYTEEYTEDTRESDTDRQRREDGTEIEEQINLGIG